ncbi:MAG: LPP20 family lipoprotein [Arcobacteraceae bacterium]
MIFKIPFILFLSLLVMACSQQPTLNNTAQTLPSWYVTPTPNSTLFLYGTGEGKSLEEAKNNALNDMASRLSVSLESTINQNKRLVSNTLQKEIYEKELTQNITLKVKEINFTNASVEHSQVVGNSFFVQMRVNRQELFLHQKEQFMLSENHINTSIEHSLSLPILEQIYALEKLNPTLEKAASQALILTALHNSFQSNDYVQKYHNIALKKESLKHNLRIKLSSNLSQKHFANVLIQELNQEGYKITANEQNVEIRLNSTINYSVAMGWHIAKTTTVITVISQGKIVSNHIINSVGRSSSSQDNALVSASKYFKKELDNLGLTTILYNQ